MTEPFDTSETTHGYTAFTAFVTIRMV